MRATISQSRLDILQVRRRTVQVFNRSKLI